MSDEKKCGESKSKESTQWVVAGFVLGVFIVILFNYLIKTYNKPILYAIFSLLSNFVLFILYLVYQIDYNKECDDLSVFDIIHLMAIGGILSISLGMSISLGFYNYEMNIEEMGNYSDAAKTASADTSVEVARTASVGGRRRRNYK